MVLFVFLVDASKIVDDDVVVDSRRTKVNMILILVAI